MPGSGRERLTNTTTAEPSWPPAEATGASVSPGSAGQKPSRLSRRASLNGAAAGLDYVALAATELVVNPVLVAGLGGVLYGAWRVLWKLTGYLWATSGRSAPALQSAIAHRQHWADEDEKRRSVGSAVVVWFIFLPFLVTIGALGAWFAPAFLHVPAKDIDEVRLAAALLVADSVVLTLLTIPSAVLQGENLGYKRMGLSAALILVGGGLSVLAIRAGAGIVGVAVANISITIATGVLFWRLTRRHVPWFGIARPDRGTLRWFLGLSWWFTAWKIISEFMIAGDVVVLGLFAPLELVTVYTLTKYVPDALSALLSNPLAGIAPGLGGMIGTGDHARAIRARNDFLALSWLVLVVVGSNILLWNESFLTLWIGRRYYAGQVATLLIVVMAAQFVLIRTDAYVIDLTLNVRRKVLLGLASTVLSVGLAILLVGRFDLGVVGVVTGFIAGRAILSVAYPLLVGRALGHPFGEQLRGSARAFGASLVLLAAGFAASGRVSARSWVALVAMAAATTAITFGAAALLGLSAAQRHRLWTRSRRIVHKPALGTGPA